MARIKPTSLLPPMLMLLCSIYQPAALAAATPAGVGYDVEADGRRVAKMSAVFREAGGGVSGGGVFGRRGFVH